jgi:hypothetical protein
VRALVVFLLCAGVSLLPIAGTSCQLSVFDPSPHDALYFFCSQIACQIIAMAHCEYLTYKSRDGEEGTIGIFQWQQAGEDECETWNDSLRGTYLKNSQFCIVVSVICALFGLFFVVTEWMCIRCCCSTLFTTLGLWLAVVFGGLTYTMYGSSLCLAGADCSFGVGATLNLVSMLLYFFASILLCTTPKPEPCIYLCCKKDEDAGKKDEDAGKKDDEEA